MKTESEPGAMWPQAKDTRDHRKLEEAGRGPPTAFRGSPALPTPRSQTSGLRTVIEVILKPPVCSDLFPGTLMQAVIRGISARPEGTVQPRYPRRTGGEAPEWDLLMRKGAPPW